MARDFAHKPREPEGSHIPRWVWLFTTSVAVAFVAFLYFLSAVPEQEGGVQAMKDQLSVVIEEAKSSVPKTTDESKPSETRETINDLKKKAEEVFEFYELLENQEVPTILPGTKAEPAPTKPQIKPEPKNTTKVPPVTPKHTAKPASTTYSGSWIIQVASFASVNDADNLRAKLMLNGLTSAAIQTAEVSGKGTYHRVMVGPFNNRAKADKAKAKLAKLSFKKVLLKQQ